MAGPADSGCCLLTGRPVFFAGSLDASAGLRFEQAIGGCDIRIVMPDRDPGMRHGSKRRPQRVIRRVVLSPCSASMRLAMPGLGSDETKAVARRLFRLSTLRLWLRFG